MEWRHSSILDGGKCLHAPADLPPRKYAGSPWTGGWMGPRADVDVVVKKKSFPGVRIRVREKYPNKCYTEETTDTRD